MSRQRLADRFKSGVTEPTDPRFAEQEVQHRPGDRQEQDHPQPRQRDPDGPTPHDDPDRQRQAYPPVEDKHDHRDPGCHLQPEHRNGVDHGSHDTGPSRLSRARSAQKKGPAKSRAKGF